MPQILACVLREGKGMREKYKNILCKRSYERVKSAIKKKHFVSADR